MTSREELAQKISELIRSQAESQSTARMARAMSAATECRCGHADSHHRIDGPHVAPYCRSCQVRCGWHAGNLNDAEWADGVAAEILDLVEEGYEL